MPLPFPCDPKYVLAVLVPSFLSSQWCSDMCKLSSHGVFDATQPMLHLLSKSFHFFLLTMLVTTLNKLSCDDKAIDMYSYYDSPSSTLLVLSRVVDDVTESSETFNVEAAAMATGQPMGVLEGIFLCSSCLLWDKEKLLPASKRGSARNLSMSDILQAMQLRLEQDADSW